METIKYLYGASSHGKVILEILKSKKIIIDAIVDDNPQFDFLSNIPVLKVSETKLSSVCEIIISIGNNTIRKKIASKLEVSFFTALHESAVISETAEIKNGSVVMAGAIINSSAKIGEHCIINTGSIIDHDCEIDNYCHVSPNASLAGNVIVGEGTHIGIGSCIIQGVKIGKWVTIGAGTVIVKDVPDFAVIVGNPGRIIKYHKINE